MEFFRWIRYKMKNVNRFIGDKLHANLQIHKFKWIISNYGGFEWLFYINKSEIYYEDFDDYTSFHDIKNRLLERAKTETGDASVDITSCIRDIKDGPEETFYTVRLLKDTLKKL